MKFDVVIGNPPYNRGADIDFINLSYKLSKKYVCMITPAKWQTADNDQSIASQMSYGQFRDKLVPHMSHIVFYPCCKDVFDILQVDGITYFLIDKEVHSEAIIENRCKWFPELNSIETRSILNRETLLNIGNELVNELKPYTPFTFSNITSTKKYKVYMNLKAPGGALSTLENRRKTMFVSYGEIRLANEVSVRDKDTMAVFESDSIDECKSFLSWLGTRFTQFFCFINQSKLTGIYTSDCFRFVPEPTVLDIDGNKVPGRFDHIYTDKELYKTFNIPQKYIDIIEEIIKAREY